jgi:formylglycine-generating enzyme required for sulfatase activity
MRAGGGAPFWWGKSISTDMANYDGNSTYAGSAKGENRQKTVPVQSFSPNPWGLYQVHGNVWEWVEDCYQEYYKDHPRDGSAYTAEGCIQRAIRGGSWLSDPKLLRAGHRNSAYNSDRGFIIGFRVAMTLEPTP